MAKWPRLPTSVYSLTNQKQNSPLLLVRILVEQLGKLFARRVDGGIPELVAGGQGPAGLDPGPASDHGGALLTEGQVPHELRQRDEGRPAQGPGEGGHELAVVAEDGGDACGQRSLMLVNRSDWAARRPGEWILGRVTAKSD